MTHLCETPGNSDRDDGGDGYNDNFVYDENDWMTLMTKKKIVMMKQIPSATHWCELVVNYCRRGDDDSDDNSETMVIIIIIKGTKMAPLLVHL